MASTSQHGCHGSTAVYRQWEHTTAALSLTTRKERPGTWLHNAHQEHACVLLVFASGGGLGGMFSSPEVLARLTMDPRTRPLLADPGFKAMVGSEHWSQGRCSSGGALHLLHPLLAASPSLLHWVQSVGACDDTALQQQCLASVLFPAAILSCLCCSFVTVLLCPCPAICDLMTTL
jgi:hypothetical protein